MNTNANVKAKAKAKVLGNQNVVVSSKLEDYFYRGLNITEADAIEEFLTDPSLHKERVVRYSFGYCPLPYMMSSAAYSEIGNVGRMIGYNNTMVPLAPDFLATADTKHLKVKKVLNDKYDKYVPPSVKSSASKQKKPLRTSTRPQGGGTLSEQLYLKGKEGMLIAPSLYRAVYDMQIGETLVAVEHDVRRQDSTIVSTTVLSDSDSHTGSGTGTGTNAGTTTEMNSGTHVKKNSGDGSITKRSTVLFASSAANNYNNKNNDRISKTTTTRTKTTTSGKYYPSSFSSSWQVNSKPVLADVHSLVRRHYNPIFAFTSSFPQYSTPSSTGGMFEGNTLVSLPTFFRTADELSRSPQHSLLNSRTWQNNPVVVAAVKESAEGDETGGEEEGNGDETGGEGGAEVKVDETKSAMLTGSSEYDLCVCDIYIKYDRKLVSSLEKAEAFDMDMIQYVLSHVDPSQPASDYVLFDSVVINSAMDTINTMLNTIFGIIIGIMMLLAMFSLLAAMNTNVMQATAEIGVQRSMGVSSAGVARQFVEESFVLVGTAALIGTVIGTVIGNSFILIMATILGTGFSFYFPWQMVIVMLSVSVLISIFASLPPALAQLKKQIANIMKES